MLKDAIQGDIEDVPVTRVAEEAVNAGLEAVKELPMPGPEKAKCASKAAGEAAKSLSLLEQSVACGRAALLVEPQMDATQRAAAAALSAAELAAHSGLREQFRAAALAAYATSQDFDDRRQVMEQATLAVAPQLGAEACLEERNELSAEAVLFSLAVNLGLQSCRSCPSNEQAAAAGSAAAFFVLREGGRSELASEAAAAAAAAAATPFGCPPSEEIWKAREEPLAPEVPTSKDYEVDASPSGTVDSSLWQTGKLSLGSQRFGVSALCTIEEVQTALTDAERCLAAFEEERRLQMRSLQRKRSRKRVPEAPKDVEAAVTDAHRILSVFDDERRTQLQHFKNSRS